MVSFSGRAMGTGSEEEWVGMLLAMESIGPVDRPKGSLSGHMSISSSEGIGFTWPGRSRSASKSFASSIVQLIRCTSVTLRSPSTLTLDTPISGRAKVASQIARATPQKMENQPLGQSPIDLLEHLSKVVGGGDNRVSIIGDRIRHRRLHQRVLGWSVEQVLVGSIW
jgi:hypothetical protein